MKNLIYSSTLLFLMLYSKAVVEAGTVLTKGDIAIIGMHNDKAGPNSSDVTKLVTFVDLECGTTFILTDNNAKANGTWYCNGSDQDEFGCLITVVERICAGSVMAIYNESSNVFTTASSSGKLSAANIPGDDDGNCAHYGDNAGYSNPGDNCFIITGSRCSPTFIFGLKNLNWASGDCSNKDNTDLPTSLGSAYSIAYGSAETYIYYDCSKGTSGDKTTLLGKITNKANWKNSGAFPVTPTAGGCTFTITPAVCSRPTVEATSFTVGTVTAGQAANVGWSDCAGTGVNVIAVMRNSTTTRVSPIDGTSYTASTVFGTTTAEIGGAGSSGNFVIYVGLTAADPFQISMPITGLSGSTTYKVDVYIISCFTTCYSANPLIGTINTPLPVELIYFSASGKDDVVNFTWTTASEKNNNYFEIESSENGIDFIPVGIVKGNGNSNEYRYYTFSESFDHSPYFRLKQVDFDGKSSSSDIISLNEKNEKEISILSVYPQPASKELNIQFNTGLPAGSKISIFDLRGIEIYETTSQEQINHVAVDTRNISAGIYFVNVVTKDQGLVKKIIVE